MKNNIVLLVVLFLGLGCSHYSAQNVEIKKISIPGQNAGILTERATAEAMEICLKEGKTIEIISTEVIEADVNEIDIDDEELQGKDEIVVVDLAYKCI